MTSVSTDRINGLSTSVAVKAPCACGTTANITLSAEQTIDGVTTSESRVLVKNQTTTTENGIYRTGTGSWTREPDFDGNRDVVTGTLVFITAGTTLANTLWQVSTSSDPDPGEAMAFTQVQTAGATGATGATGAQGATGAAGTVDITSQSAITVAQSTDLLLISDTSDAGTNKKITAGNFLGVVNGLTEDTAPAATDFVLTYDVSTAVAAARKVKPSNLFGTLNGLTEDTAPSGTADFVLTYDASTAVAAARKVKPSNLLKTINDLTEDTAPDILLDYIATYDASGTAAKKVLPKNILKGINDLTADSSPDTAADYVVTYDASAGVAKKVLLNLIGGGSAATTTTAGIAELATAAEVQTGTDTGRVPSVSVLGSHQSAAKFWADVGQSGATPSLTDSYNVTSITDLGAGNLRVTIATDFASANWCPLATVEESSTLSAYQTIRVISKTAGTIGILVTAQTTAQDDPEVGWNVAGFGDQ